MIPQMKSMMATTAIQNLVNTFFRTVPTSFMNLLLISGVSWFIAVVAVETETCNGATMSLKAEERLRRLLSAVYCRSVIQNIDMKRHWNVFIKIMQIYNVLWFEIKINLEVVIYLNY